MQVKAGSSKAHSWIIIIPVVVLILSSAFIVSDRAGLIGAKNVSRSSSNSSSSYSSTSTSATTSSSANQSTTTVNTTSFISITNPDPINVNSTPLPGIGLSIHLSLNATVMLPGDRLNLSFIELNTLDVSNNLNWSENWALPSLLDWWPCNQTWYSFEIYQGYYTLSNISGATPLPQFPPGYGAFCHTNLFNSIEFQPNSDVTLFIGGMLDGSVGPMTPSLVLSGYYPTTTQVLVNGSSYIFLPFTQGVYTLTLGDQWGDLVVVYFTVI